MNDDLTKIIFSIYMSYCPSEIFDRLNDEIDDVVIDVKYAELHAWLEYYLDNKTGIVTELTPRLHENYQQWLMKNGLTETYDCNYHRFATRLMHNFKDIKVSQQYVKKVGTIRKSIIDVEATLKLLWR